MVISSDEEGARPDFIYAGRRFALRLASGDPLDVDAGAFVRADRRGDGADDLVVVRDGEELLVRGLLVEEPDPRASSDGNYRDAPTTRLVLVGTGARRTVEITPIREAPAARARAESAWMGWAEGEGESDWVRVSRDEYLRARVGEVVPRIGYGGFDNFGHTPRADRLLAFFAAFVIVTFAWRYRAFTRARGHSPAV